VGYFWQAKYGNFSRAPKEEGGECRRSSAAERVLADIMGFDIRFIQCSAKLRKHREVRAEHVEPVP